MISHGCYYVDGVQIRTLTQQDLVYMSAVVLAGIADEELYRLTLECEFMSESVKAIAKDMVGLSCIV